MFEILQNLRDTAEARAQAITAQHADWPCRKGCDHCCRNLADWPALSELEWQEVEAGLSRLPVEIGDQVRARVAAAHGTSSPPYTCPFLDTAQGACLIYAHRPIACRTFGFYVDERGLGLYCQVIRERVDGGELADVVWGNQGAMDMRLDALGPRLISPTPSIAPQA